MKKTYGKGLAIHIDPETCGAAREGGAEALTGESTGRVFSRVRNSLRDADAVRRSGRPHPRRRYPRCLEILRGHRPRAGTEAPRMGTGRSRVHPRRKMSGDASGSLRTHADDERTREVGQTSSTCEVPEQGRATGGGGCITRKRGCWSSDHSQPKTGRSAEKGNRRRSTSSASPTSVGRRGATDASRSCGRRFANGCKRS